MRAGGERVRTERNRFDPQIYLAQADPGAQGGQANSAGEILQTALDNLRAPPIAETLDFFRRLEPFQGIPGKCNEAGLDIVCPNGAAPIAPPKAPEKEIGAVVSKPAAAVPKAPSPGDPKRLLETEFRSGRVVESYAGKSNFVVVLIPQIHASPFLTQGEVGTPQLAQIQREIADVIMDLRTKGFEPAVGMEGLDYSGSKAAQTEAFKGRVSSLNRVFETRKKLEYYIAKNGDQHGALSKYLGYLERVSAQADYYYFVRQESGDKVPMYGLDSTARMEKFSLEMEATRIAQGIIAKFAGDAGTAAAVIKSKKPEETLAALTKAGYIEGKLEEARRASCPGQVNQGETAELMGMSVFVDESLVGILRPFREMQCASLTSKTGRERTLNLQAAEKVKGYLQAALKGNLELMASDFERIKAGLDQHMLAGRNKAVADNIQKLAPNLEGRSRTLVVPFGAEHTDGLKGLLKQRGISFVVIKVASADGR